MKFRNKMSKKVFKTLLIIILLGGLLMLVPYGFFQLIGFVSTVMSIALLLLGAYDLIKKE